jgi:hypothetical protein
VAAEWVVDTAAVAAIVNWRIADIPVGSRLRTPDFNFRGFFHFALQTSNFDF